MNVKASGFSTDYGRNKEAYSLEETSSIKGLRDEEVT